ncbi:MAG TPA: hypothetical protein VGL56_18525 [Fimbriimonadaceae bacterium]
MNVHKHAPERNKLAIALICFAGLSASLSAQSYPPAWSASANGYAAGDLVEYNQNVYRSLVAQAKGAIKSLVTPGIWELSELRFSATPMKVGTLSGDTFKTFAQAWSFIHNARIDPGATFTMILDTTPPVFSQPLNLDHPYGSQIFIQGASQKVALDFNGCDGIVLDNGHTLGGLSNILVQGTDGSSNPNLTAGTHGMLVSSNAVLNTQGVIVNDFDIGTESQGSGTLIMGAPSNPDWINSFGTYGVFATDHSLTDIRVPLANGSSVGLDGVSSAQVGYYCTQNAELKAPGCSSAYCYAQFKAETGGFINATGATADGDFSNLTFYATFGGTIDATSSTAGRPSIAYYALYMGKVIANNAKVTSLSQQYDFYAYGGSTITTFTVTVPTGATYQADGTSGANKLGSLGSVILH